MIEFVEVSSGESVGTVRLVNGELKADPALQSIVDAWERRDKPADEFMEFYSSWSNGYLQLAISSRAFPGSPGYIKLSDPT